MYGFVLDEKPFAEDALIVFLPQVGLGFLHCLFKEIGALIRFMEFLSGGYAFDLNSFILTVNRHLSSMCSI